MIWHWCQCKWQTDFAHLWEISLSWLAAFCQSKAAQPSQGLGAWWYHPQPELSQILVLKLNGFTGRRRQPEHWVYHRYSYWLGIILDFLLTNGFIWFTQQLVYRQLRARRALMLLKDVPLRTRRALSLYKVYDNSALLVLNGTLLNSVNRAANVQRRVSLFSRLEICILKEKSLFHYLVK